MNKPQRRAFFISDRTGITAESMGLALLNQFDAIHFKCTTYPFIDTVEKAEGINTIINNLADNEQFKPFIFFSIIDKNISQIIRLSKGVHISFYDTFMGTLEKEMGILSNQSVGLTHGIQDTKKYDARMDAVNFALNHDDGINDRDLKEADVILMGVSRSGKTPTCLYLALNYSLRAANYPLTPEDLTSHQLPRMVKPFQKKLYGLTIEPNRLHHIRTERRPNSNYASIESCKREIREAEEMFHRFHIPYTNTTHKSIEELAASIMVAANLQRRF